MDKLCSHAAVFLILAIGNAVLVTAGDPDLLKDFVVPLGLDPTTITSQYFTFTGFRALREANLTGRTTALVTKATLKEFSALEGQGVSVAAIMYPPSGMNPPHVHPRASELLIVLLGSLEVGFVDTANKLYTQTLQAPDMFVFPKGLVHFQVNTKTDSPSIALGILGSANAGTVLLPSTLFGSGISADILAKAFKTDEQTINKLIEANK